ncbi:uncharacterized protein ATNIH1004_011308 [Aspergillus tanneri]|uniref:Uncharacterized protein n=1 Tax=Aspergillus tanneri TaxID=1220188 RepID=A0A5M9MAN7_9EURO|nr:uncharacterized protein ATNIH1004_011308 [Aspergillus tanneri]KAA8642364.1 hypothetical protein ATNIH1004_011308 [Aspergillus tanneri]
MSADRELEQSSHCKFEVSELNFTACWHGIQLRKFDTHGVDDHREMSRGYRAVLDRKETLARHLGLPLVSDSFEEAFSKAFSTRIPSLVPPTQQEPGDSPPSWIDVLQEVDPVQLGQRPNGSHHRCHSGLLQKLIDRWPHPRDVQAEVEILGFTIRRLSAWKQSVLQALEEDNALLEDLQTRLNGLRNYTMQHFLSESTQTCEGAATTRTVVPIEPGREQEAIALDDTIDIHDADPQESGTSESPHTCDQRDEDDEMSEEPQEGMDALPIQPGSPRTWTSSRLRWSFEEESRLLPWLKAHDHLSWPDIEQEYFREFGIYRKELALKTKARRIEQNGLRGARKTRTRRARGGYVDGHFPVAPDSTSAGTRETRLPWRLTAAEPNPMSAGSLEGSDTQFHQGLSTATDMVHAKDGEPDQGSSITSLVNGDLVPSPEGRWFGSSHPLSLGSLLA